MYLGAQKDMKPDFSEWLNEQRVAIEECAWEDTGRYKQHAKQVLRAAKPHDTVLELGCGTGWVARELGNKVRYTGVDKNPTCIALAWEKNPSATFMLADIREYRGPQVDVVCSFAVLKHFSLEEWSNIFRLMLSFGRRGVLQVQTTLHESYADDMEYNHVWINQWIAYQVVYMAGHELLDTEFTWQDGPLAEITLFTRRVR